MGRSSDITDRGGKAAAEPRSAKAFARARNVFPDGTTRITVERDPIPRYMHRGEGAYLIDLEGRRYLDLNGNFTTLIHGHAFAPVTEAVTRQMQSGSCFANPTEGEIELAELLCARIPGIERLRFVSTGTEAVLFAIKAARAFTGRPAIAKIEGAYHGAYDWAEVSQVSTPDNWGSTSRPASTPFYRGMPESVLGEGVALRFNDPAGVRSLLAERAGEIAAILLDPMPSRAGLIAPTPEFVAAVQETARAHDILVISDEVLNLRQGYHGAATRFGIAADLFTLGKIIGGGLPIGAIGGRREVMAVFDAEHGRPPLPQGGTFSANPLSMVAGLAAMAALDVAAFERLEALGDRLRARLRQSIERHGAPFSVTGAASLFRLHPKAREPREFRDAYCATAETAVLQQLVSFFGESGIVLPTATACLSTPMAEAEVDLVGDVFERFLETQPGVYAKLAE